MAMAERSSRDVVTSTGCAPSTGGWRARARRRSSSTATRPTPRTGCRSCARVEGPAIALDLPGWGFSERPATDRFDYSPAAASAASSASFLEHARDRASTRSSSTTGASSALIAAQRRPERVRRLVVINAVPFLPGYRWHWVARIWRRAAARRARQRDRHEGGAAPALGARRRPRRGRMPSEFVDLDLARASLRDLAAILALYRSADPDVLAAAGRGSAISTVPRWSSGGGRTPTSRRASGAPTPSGCRTPSCSSSTEPGTGRGSIARTLIEHGRPVLGGVAVPVFADRTFTIRVTRARPFGSDHTGSLPKGWLDAACQFCLFFVAYNGYQIVRGIADGEPRARVRQRRPADRHRALARDLLRARLPAGAARPRRG